MRHLFSAITVLLLLFCRTVLFAQTPTANFTYLFNANSQCAPAIVYFSNTSVGGVAPLTYEWTFQDGNPSSSTQTNPSVSFLTCGSKTISLKVTGANGQTNTKTITLSIACKPNPQFVGIPPLSGCPPLNVSFTNQSTNGGGPPGGMTYIWDFCDGVTSTLTNPSHIFTLPGSYCVKLKVTNQFGCFKDTTYNNYIQVTNPPIANITSGIASSCTFPFTVNFSGTSSTPVGGVTYQWTFPGGNPSSSTLATPNVTYNAAGTYNVTLKVTDANGCTHTLTLNNYVNIASNTASFTPSTTTTCVGNTVDFQAGSAISYNWTITPNSGFNNNTGGTTSSALNLEFTNSGSYNVCLNMEFNGGCTASACSTIVVNPSPSANFGILGNVTTCQPPQTITISPLPAAGNTYNWSFPGSNNATSTLQNPGPHTYTNCGTYPVSLTVTNSFGCQASNTINNAVNINCPLANFMPVLTTAQQAGHMCVPTTVQFDASASSGNPNQFYWNWNYDQNPNGWQPAINTPQTSHTFTTPGCYTIGLMISNAQNCRDTLILMNLICVGNMPQANFTVNDTTPCINEPITFTNLSIPPVIPPNTPPEGVSYLWKFGDGQTSTLPNPNKTYQDTGYKDITLIICWYGCCDTLVKEKYIYVAPPKANIVVSRPCNEPFCVQFSGKTSIGASTYQWTFTGPASPPNSTLDSVHVCWPGNGGPYTAKLKVVNTQYGCKDSTTVTVTLVKPIAGFTMSPTTGCKPLKSFITFAGSGLYTAQYFIFAGPTCTGTPIATVNANTAYPGGNPNYYTFNNVGVYSVRQVVKNTIGCTDTLERNAYITVYGLTPKFKMTDSLGCAPKLVQFTNLTQPNSTSSPTSYLWVFGDPSSGASNTSTLTNPTHNYLNQGNYDVWLIAYDNHGCSDTLKRPQAVKLNKPVADFITPNTTICANQQACFTSLSTGTNISYYWNFGDPPTGSLNTSTLFNPCHLYTAQGTYTIFLRVTDQYGCKDSITKPAYIHVGDLNANIQLSDSFSSCPPLFVSFTDISGGADSASTFHWNFGDGVQSVLESPSHLYTQAGYFNITFSITNQYGCNKTVHCDSCIFIGGPTATVSASGNQGCAPYQVCFSATNSNSISYIWNTGENIQSGSDTLCHTYNDEGIFRAEVFLADTSGCTYSYYIDSIYVTNNEAKFGLTPHELCGQGTVQFTDSSQALTPIIAWQWNFNDPASGANNTSSLKNPTHYYNTPGTYHITMTSTASGGCTNTYSDSVKVVVTPAADFTYTATSLCEGTPIQFYDNTTLGSGSITSYLWNFGDPGNPPNTSNQANPIHTFPAEGQYNVRLIVVSSNGCIDTIVKQITINQTPLIALTPNQSICIGDSTILQFSGAGTYSWMPASSLNNATLPNPTASPSTTTTYTLTYTDANGCSTSATTTVTVNLLPVANAGPDQSTYSGGTVTMNASGGSQYFWLPSAAFSNPGLQNPTVSPTITSTYTVIVTSVNGCTASDEMVVFVTPCPIVNAGNDTSICVGSSVVLTGNTDANTYQWTSIPAGTNSSNLTLTVTPSVNTTYVFTATNTINGCVRKDSIIVTLLTPFTPNAGSDVAICIGASTTLQASGSTQYSWSPAASLSNATIANPIATPTATTTYTVSVSDGLCYTLTAQVIVTVNPLPNASAGTDTSICLNDSGQLHASGGIQYQWAPNTNITNPGSANPSVNPTIQTTYTVTVTDINGCVKTDDVVVSIYPLPTVVVSADAAICIYDTTQLHASGGILFHWTPGSSLSDPLSDSPTATPTITTSYTVTVTDNNACHNTGSVMVTVNPLPNAEAGPNQTICSQTAAYLIASGGVQYSWTPIALVGNPNQQGTIAYPQTPQYFYVLVTDANGCKNTDSVYVNILYPFSVQFPKDTCVCLGSIMTLSINDTSSVPHYYVWSPLTGIIGGTTGFNISASPYSNITYTVIVSDGQCYADTGKIQLCVNPIPSIDAGPNQQMLLGESVQLSGVGTGQFTWSPDTSLSCATCQKTQASPMQTTQYTASVIDSNGCTNKDSMMVYVVCSDQVIYIPNAFSPDGDEVNPEFKIYGTGIKELVFLRIYNRWGEKVFETEDLSKGWDGTHRGKLQEPGVYVYYMEAVCTTGQTIAKQGNISLIR